MAAWEVPCSVAQWLQDWPYLMIKRRLLMNTAMALLAVVVLTTLGFFGLRWLQRSFFYPVPVAMPAAVTDDVQSALRRLESALRDSSPKVLEDLQPGLTEEEIASIQREHVLLLSEDLKALYMWRNGSRADSKTCLVPGQRFLPLHDSLELREAARRQVAEQMILQRVLFEAFAGHRTGWMTVLDDGAGDGYFYDQSRAESGGYFFYHFAEDRHYRFFPSLSNFLVGAAECYENRIYSSDREGHAVEDFKRSFPLWPRYASSPGAQ
jgi:cell wall assembly regulator SMI1